MYTHQAAGGGDAEGGEREERKTGDGRKTGRYTMVIMYVCE